MKLRDQLRLRWKLATASRSTLENPSTSLWEFFTQMDEGSAVDAGVTVNSKTSLKLGVIFACVRVLSESIASLPLHVMQRDESTKKTRKVIDHPLYSLLHDSPNEDMTSFTWREVSQGHVSLRGNSYSVILRNGGGKPLALWPQIPDHVDPRINEETSFKLKYLIQTNIGPRLFDKEDVLHVKGLGTDGYRGYSTIEVAMDAIGLGLAMQKHGAEFFGQGARPDGILAAEGNLTDKQREANIKSWNNRHANKRAVAVLSGGLKWQSMAVRPDEAQFIESRRFSVADLARFFRMQPHMIGDLEHATFSNIEQQDIDFVKHTLRPHLVRWEQELNMKLLTPEERAAGFFIVFNVDGLLRGDYKTRTEGYASGIASGWLSRNEAREFENMDPEPGLEKFLVPLNMGDDEDPDPDPNNDGSVVPPTEEEEEE